MCAVISLYHCIFRRPFDSLHACFEVSNFPLFEPFEDNRCCPRFLTRQQVICIAIWKGAGPIMPDVSIVVVHDHIVPAMPRHLSLSIAQVRSRIDTCIVSIALRPVVHVCDNIRTVCVTTRVDAALIWYCSISIAMELHQRYGLTTRVARRRLLICIEVKGTGYRSKSCDTLGCLSVTCENASKAASI